MNKIAKIRERSVLQHDSSDCGAACLLSVIRFCGGTGTIEEIRKLSGTTHNGTTMLGLYQAAGFLGMDATGYEAGTGDIMSFSGILILHVTAGNGLEHYIVCFGYEKGSFILWDPAKGLVLMNGEELSGIWKSGKCLSVGPNESFIYEKEDRKSRLKWILRTVRPEANLLLTGCATGIIISILGLVMAVFTQKLIDRILPSGDIRFLILSSCLAFIMLAFRIVISAVRQLLLLIQGKVFNVRIVDEFYRALLDLPKSFFDTRKTGDFVARMNDTMRIQKVLSEIVITYSIDVLVLVITIIVLFYYSPVSAIISLVCLPLLYFMIRAWSGEVIGAQQDLMAGYAASESNFIDSLAGIQEIRSLNWSDYFFSRNHTVYSAFQERIFALGKIRTKLNLFAGLMGTFFMILVLIYSSVQVIRSGITQGELMAILSLSTAMLPSVLNLAMIGIPLNEARVAMNRMFDFTRIRPEDDPGRALTERQPVCSIEMRHVSFRYPGRALQLSDVCLRAERGKIVSIIGECGSGKSTLASLLLRFYSPESGEIVINDGIPASGVSLKNWRSGIGLIPQEIHIFNGTILQNILSEISESKIKEMAGTISQFGLDDFFSRFPAGLLTQVGEDGLNLSGGEKQILAFIRVLVNKPDILIIDEGTSDMDSGTESRIIGILQMLRKETGIIMISHRMNIVKHLSDEVYVLAGRVLKKVEATDAIPASDRIFEM